MEAVVDTINELTADVTKENIVFFAVGMLLFAWWLMKAVLRGDPLADAAPRRNDLPPYTPLIPFFIWLFGPALGFALNDAVLPDIADWQKAAIINLSVLIAGLVGIALMLAMARRHFARRLKGLGLRPAAIPKDAGLALINLISIAPIFTAAIVLTLIVSRMLLGADFKIPTHEQLELMTKHPELPVRILVIIVAVVIAPVFEEMLFRGFIQTIVFSYVQRPWTAIIATSMMFAVVHITTPTHWPALFILSMCIGYSYEKSRSLFRPIFIHALFNGLSVLATLQAQ